MAVGDLRDGVWGLLSMGIVVHQEWEGVLALHSYSCRTKSCAAAARKSS